MNEDFLYRDVPALGRRMFRLCLATNYGVEGADLEWALEQGINYVFWTPNEGRVTKSLKAAIKLQQVLTMEEIWKIICATNNLKHRMILMTTCSAGLRAIETINLKPNHIDSKTMLIKVKGKRNKDRYALLSKKLLVELKSYYRKYRTKTYLFPSSFKKKKDLPLSYETIR